MKRTQLYLDEEMAKALSRLSRERGMTVSELVREWIREKLGTRVTLDQASLARETGGSWKRRGGLVSVEREVRRLRKDKRRERMKIG